MIIIVITICFIAAILNWRIVKAERAYETLNEVVDEGPQDLKSSLKFFQKQANEAVAERR